MPAAEDLPRLIYTRMVIEESMRLYPPVHTMARLALADDRLRDRPLPAGASVMIVPWLLHRHRHLWDIPDRFDPERFAPAEAAARPRFAYIPFGAGPRICIGAAFAMTEAVLLLSAIALRWQPQLAKGAIVEPVGLITLRPRFGLPMIFYGAATERVVLSSARLARRRLPAVLATADKHTSARSGGSQTANRVI